MKTPDQYDGSETILQKEEKVRYIQEAFGMLINAEMGRDFVEDKNEKGFISGDAASIYVLVNLNTLDEPVVVTVKIGWGEFSEYAFQREKTKSKKPNPLRLVEEEIYCVKQVDSFLNSITARMADAMPIEFLEKYSCLIG